MPKPKYFNSINSLEQFYQWIVVQNYSSVFLLVDTNTMACCLPVFRDTNPGLDIHTIQVDAGEQNKTIQSAQHIWNELLAGQADRNSLLINLGGGMISDLGGFAASTFKRGIDFIHIPTSLLAMVDAAIGGKTGINFHDMKNQVGTFTIPKAVIIQMEFLATLPQKEMDAGFAEMLKYGLIADAGFWKELTSISHINLSTIAQPIIQRCIQIKDDVVSTDFRETGARKILNFGHTVGHAFESYFMQNKENHLLHGEAIAHGMLVESIVSKNLTGLSWRELQQIKTFILDKYGKLSIFEADFDNLFKLILADKKNSGENVKMTLLKQIGEARTDITVMFDQLKDSFIEYTSL